MISSVVSDDLSNCMNNAMKMFFDILSPSGENLFIFNMRVASKLSTQDEMIVAILNGIISYSPMFTESLMDEYKSFENEYGYGMYFIENILELPCHIIESLKKLYEVVDFENKEEFINDVDFKIKYIDLKKDQIAFNVFNAMLSVMKELLEKDSDNIEGNIFMNNLLCMKKNIEVVYGSC